MALNTQALLGHDCVLQHIVVNAALPLEAESLYARHTALPVKGLRHTTDTYINIFHKKRWQALTGISSYRLQISCRGKGVLELHGAFAPEREFSPVTPASSVLLDTCAVNSGPGEAFCWTPQLEGPYDFFFLAWEEEREGALSIDKAQYIASSDIRPRSIRVAIVTTTYKRHDDIGRLVAMYRQACENILEISLSTHLFIINNEREDEDFLQQYAHPQISVITNAKNVGGSGGFAQGARLAVEDGSFSHVLFMDDDALAPEESWFRTLRLSACLREELRFHPLSGAMFTREQPAYCHAMIEALDARLHRLCLSGETNMEGAADCLASLAQAHDVCARLLQTEKEQQNKSTAPHPYAAWWYGLFPIETFLEFGYPAPYFYQKDDQEFGLRIRRTPLFLNGVCVWHPSFQNKSSALRHYLNFRNYALVCATYTKHWRRFLLKRLFFGVTRSLAANDYEKAALFLLSIEDFLSFPNVPCEGKKLMIHIKTVTQYNKNTEIPIYNSPHQIDIQSLRYNILPMLAVLFTLGGGLVPPFWRRSYTVAPFSQVGGRWASQWTAYPGESSVRHIQPLKAARIIIKFLYCVIKILKGCQVKYFNQGLERQPY